ncbi:ribose-phosphate diphosphokinase, partial [bacterium]|nr:ribose-phosphate diphosphokinase [bacterium]
VESFQANPNKTLLNIIFAAQTAKDLGVKKVVLISPYLAFMRQDKRFKDGEAINAQIMAKIINTYIDKFITIDPHLHRIRHMDDIFHIPAKNLSANLAISNFIKKNFKNTIIMGPDWESYQWAEEISSNLGIKNTVLEKTRHSYRHVDVMMKNQIDMKDKNVIIVDDIISTGNTMIKAAATAKSNGAKTITAIGVHGLFVENAYEKMNRYFDNIYTVNTITHKTNKIDIIPTIVEELNKQI